LSGFSFAAAKRCFDEHRAGEETDRLARYWLSLWRGDKLPVRADFKPREVAELLPSISIFDVVPGESVRCRLVGSRMVEGAGGVDVTGRNWLAMTAPSNRPERLRRFSEVARGAIGRGLRVGRRLSGDPQFAEEVMLPFGDVAADGARQVLTHLAWVPSLYDPTLTGLDRNNGLLLQFALTPLRDPSA
jgi:hypothetical protein